MARRGRFGRLPRRAPDLSSQLVAIAREMQNLRDQNIKTAWEKGGEFEGKEVTDEMILQHWKDRRSGVDPNDPLWDYYNNLVENYEFSIEESKMTLKYAQKKVGEGTMSAFYRRWANKLPKDSEAYRNLMRSAAQYADAAASRARGSSAASKQKAYNSEWMANWRKHTKPYADSTSILVDAAVQAGIMDRAEADRVKLRLSGSSDGAELTEMLTAGTQWDQNQLLLLFDQINTNPEYKMYKDALEKRGIEGLNYDSYLGLAEDRRKGMTNGIAIAKKYDDKDTAQKVKAGREAWDDELLLLKDVDAVAAYNRLRHQYEEDLAETDDPYEIDRLNKRYATALRGVAGMAEDPATRGAMFREADANEGKLAGMNPDDWGAGTGRSTVAENPTGRRETNITGTNQNDIGETVASRQYLDEVITGLQKGEVVRVPPEVAKELGMELQKGVPFYYAPTQSVAALESNLKGAVIFTTKNGRTIPEYVPFVEVHSRQPKTVDPVTTRPLDEAKAVPGQDTLVGYQMRLPNGEMRYGTYGADGQLVWSADKPYIENTVESSGPGGTIVVSPREGSGKEVYNPRDILNPRYAAGDPGLMNSDKFPDVFGAAHLASSSGRKDLIGLNENDVRTFYTGKFGNETTQVPDPNDPSKTIPVKVVDLAMEDLHATRVKAAAYESDPKLMQKEAAATAGLKFWDDYEDRFERRQRREMDSLLAETPAAKEALRLQREAAEQRKLLGSQPGYETAPKDPFGKVETIAPWEVRQRAIDLIKGSKAASDVRTQTGLELNAEKIVDRSPSLKLPDVIQQYTGQSAPWVVNPYQPAGPNNPLHNTGGKPAPSTWSPGVAGVGTGAAMPKPPSIKPPEPPKPPPTPPPAALKPPNLNPYQNIHVPTPTPVASTTRRTIL